MPTGVVHSSDDGGDAPASSQGESAAQTSDGSSPRSRRDDRPKSPDSNDIDSQVSSTADEAGDELMESQEDVPSNKAGREEGETSRALRSRSVKQEPVDSTPQTQSRRVVIKRTKQSCDDDEPELQKPAKRGRKPLASTEIKKFEKESQGLLERFTSKAHESESLRYENQDLKDQVRKLEFKLGKSRQAHKESEMLLKQKKDQQQRENARLQDENNELRDENDKLEADFKKRISELVAALDDNKRDATKYVKVSDSDIAAAWMLLSYNVRDLVSQCLTEQPSNHYQTLKSLIRAQRLLWQDIIPLRTNILRRSTWESLVSGIFSGQAYIWQGELGQFLTQSLSGKGHASIKDPQYLKIISQLKSKVIADLDEKSSVHQNALSSEVEKVWSRLGPFIPESKDKEFKDRMEALFTQAVDLHIIMMKSKAIFQVKWIGENDGTTFATYDPVTMEPYLRDGGSEDTVKLVEAPGLMKIGNADGENFGQNMILCKSMVILQEKDDGFVLESDF
ncbi:hypothetical protein J3F83DRAFT_773467 [Trichoderma novae-zelandiae]